MTASTSAPPTTPDVPGLTWRPLGPADLDAWWALQERVQVVDRDPHPVSRSGLEAWVGRHGDDLAADTLVGLDDGGDVRVVARVELPAGQVDAVRAFVPGVVDPSWRGRGIGRQVLAWQVARGTEKVGDARPAEVGTFVRDVHPDAHRLLEHAGLRPARYFASMSRDVAAHPASLPALAEGLHEVDLAGADVVEAVRLAQNDAFRDHWGYHPDTPESWAAETTANESFRPDLSRALVDRDGVVAGYAVVSVFVDEGTGDRVGHLELLGTVRAWRGRGLASYLLERTAEVVASEGLGRTTLGVDSASPTGADRLYVAHGYERVGGSTYWATPVG